MKKTVVTRKWLLNFADKIYNPKTKEFLNLCAGKLQNGPDPDNKKRSMHCGLGEFYFQITGVHPYDAKARIDNRTIVDIDVIDLIVERSSLLKKLNSDKVELLKAITKVKSYFASDLKSSIKENIIQYDVNYNDKFDKFREILSEIPHENDRGAVYANSFKTYQNRAKRVASLLRKAAKMLPA